MNGIASDTELPKSLKLIMVFIDRVGFPTMAFLLMSYMCFATLEKMTVAINDNTAALTKLTTITQIAATAQTAAAVAAVSANDRRGTR